MEGAVEKDFRLLDRINQKPNLSIPIVFQPDYFKTTGISILQGKDFKDNGSNFGNGIIINETGAKYLDLENPVGVRVNFRGREQEIIGLVKDFNYESLHEKIQPLMFFA